MNIVQPRLSVIVARYNNFCRRAKALSTPGVVERCTCVDSRCGGLRPRSVEEVDNERQSIVHKYGSNEVASRVPYEAAFTLNSVACTFGIWSWPFLGVY
jgi:hypothetical protein